MPLIIRHPADMAVDLNGVARIAWRKGRTGYTLWTIVSSVPMYFGDVSVLPPATGQTTIEVPDGYKLRVGKAVVTLTLDAEDNRYRVTIDSPKEEYKAYRTDDPLAPALFQPKDGARPNLNGQKKYAPVGGVK